MDAFRYSQEFTEEKVKFGEEAFIAGQDVYCQRIAARFLDLDHLFLDEKEADDDLPSKHTAAKEQSHLG